MRYTKIAATSHSRVFSFSLHPQYPHATVNQRTWLVLLVAALGYFVDIFDLALFGIVRVQSLRGIGVSEGELLNVGVSLLNCQMTGMLLGGLLWGVIGDRRGRVSVLFGSILLYSLANIANGFVTDAGTYSLLRFISGIGLAGELGAAITLVSEVLPTNKRGYGTAVVAGVGLSGAVAAGILAEAVSWRATYWIGGGMGIGLLILRMGILESDLFIKVKEASSVKRGDLRLLLTPRSRLLKYISCILLGVPIWFCAGILMTFAPEIGKELGTTEPLSAGKAIMYSYIGVAIGDVLSGLLSQWAQSRKKIVFWALLAEALIAILILTSHGISSTTFYLLAGGIGLATGYWAMFVTLTAEQFGTNLRATATTSVPNFVRGSVVPMTLAFKELSHHISLIQSACAVGFVVFILAAIGLRNVEETFSKELNYVES